MRFYSSQALITIYPFLKLLNNSTNFIDQSTTMKSRMFKIRNLGSQQEHRVSEINIKKHLDTVLPEIGQPTEGNAHFNQLVDMFKVFLKSNSQKKQTAPVKTYDMEARDRQVLVELPHIEDQNGKISESELKRWTARVVKTICSAAFHYFSKNEMNFEQAKIYCSENIFRNIVILAQGSGLSSKQIQVIDGHIKANVIDYLMTKYPLTESTEINKKLQQIVHEVDNIEALDNNYFTHTDIVFEYREDGNYNDLIMRMINDLMGLIDKQVDPEKENEVTNFNDFQEFMAGVFQKVEDEDWMRKNDKDQVMSQLKMLNKMSSFEVAEMKSPDQNPAEYKQRLRKRLEQKEKYRAKVKEYTSYLIGRKIPEDTPNYTEKEITNMNITIKSPTVLRILTKWCGQLWGKYQNGSYYSDRSESIKVQRGGNVNSLLAWMRVFLDERLREERVEIKKYMGELAENNYEMQSKLLQREIQRKDAGDEHLEQLERIGGKFSLKVVKNLHSYIIAFLNRLIHGLLSAAKRLHDDNGLGTFSFWPSPINLLTFKVGDLMRCKCSSKEKEILRIYKELQRISRQTPQKLKIVRIKNRLRSGTNDLLINVKFNNSILCEIQLAVKARASDFIKCSNLFHHYLYELKRSHFGPLTELCSIWSSLDRKTQIYQNLLDADDLKTDNIDHTCRKLGKKYEMVKYERPFVCSQCSRTYFHNNYLRSHACCNLCGFILCAKCKLGEESEQQLISSLIIEPSLRNCCTKRVRESQQLPQLGICVLIQSKLPKAQIFTYIVEQGTKRHYLLGKVNGLIHEIESMAKEKQRHRFRSKYIVFELNLNDQYPRIDYQQAKKGYILPAAIKKNYVKQKESISLMGQLLTTEQCRQILAVGTRGQKETVKNLFLADNQLDQLPFDPEDFPNLKWVTVSRNTITNYAGLEKCQNLTNFIAVQSGFEAIPTEFYGLKNLANLSFSCNTIRQISDQIGNLKKLTDFQLDDNLLSSLPEGICECQSLRSLNIESNQITALPQNIYKLQNLQKLICDKNPLTVIPARIGELKRLKQLNVSTNLQVSTLPESFVELQSLQIFDASSTAISCLPEQLGKLTNLRSLKLANCTSLPRLPASINLLKNLQKIDITSCSQIQLPESFWEITSLKDLNLSSCNLNSLPQSFKQLKRLQKLDLSNNCLELLDQHLFTDLPELTELKVELASLREMPNLWNCKKLKKLNLNNNQIARIPDDHIQNLIALQELRISFNGFQYFPPSIARLSKLVVLEATNSSITNIMEASQLQQFKNSDIVWPNLRQFLFNNNQFTEIPVILFNSRKLTNLYMSGNQIEVIPQQIINLKNLKYIDLNYNKLKEIPVQLSQLKNLEGAYLSFNQVKVVPAHLRNSTSLTNFHLDSCPIETIEAPEWFISGKVTCGQLYNLAYNIVYPQYGVEQPYQNDGGNVEKAEQQANGEDMDGDMENGNNQEEKLGNEIEAAEQQGMNENYASNPVEEKQDND